MNSSPFDPSPEAFLNAYLADRSSLGSGETWVDQMHPLEDTQTPVVPELPDFSN